SPGPARRPALQEEGSTIRTASLEKLPSGRASAAKNGSLLHERDRRLHDGAPAVRRRELPGAGPRFDTGHHRRRQVARGGGAHPRDLTARPHANRELDRSLDVGVLVEGLLVATPEARSHAGDDRLGVAHGAHRDGGRDLSVARRPLHLLDRARAASVPLPVVPMLPKPVPCPGRMAPPPKPSFTPPPSPTPA